MVSSQSTWGDSFRIGRFRQTRRIWLHLGSLTAGRLVSALVVVSGFPAANLRLHSDLKREEQADLQVQENLLLFLVMSAYEAV